MGKEKYLEILDYLAEYAKNKNESIRDIESSKSDYPEIIWLADLPKHELIEGITDTGFIQNHEYLIKMTKPKEPRPPAFPKLSEVLEQWVAKDSLTDENGGPRLKTSIVMNGKTLLSTQFPQIDIEFRQYVKDKWLEDFVAYKTQYLRYEDRVADFEVLNNIYERLYKIYSKLQQNDEDYELVSCAGLIYFKRNENAPLICRHILTSKADIRFEQNQKDDFIEVSTDIESFIRIETDAIADLTEQFDIKNLVDAEKKVYEYMLENNIINNLFDNKIKDAMSMFAEIIHSDAAFFDQINKTKEVPAKPLIYFAPSLILRKKNEGGFTSLYEKIIKHLNSLGERITLPERDEQTDSYEQIEENRGEHEAVMNQETGYSPDKVADTDNQIKIDNNPKLLTLQEFLVFTSMQNVYKVQNKVFSNKLQILGNIAFEAGEKPIYLTGTRNYSGHLIVAFENGKIGKITLESYKTDFNRKKLKNAYNNESRLIFIELIEEDTDLVAISNINKVMLFNTRQINPVGSKTTKGFQVMKSKDRSIMTKIKKLNQVKFQDIEYYRRNEGLNAVGFYLKQGDEI